MNILITGATGNIGEAMIPHLQQTDNIFIGARNCERTAATINVDSFQYRRFDFEDEECYESAFEGIDRLFLLRPPHIADINKVFRPMLLQAKKSGIKQIVFLSVLGADKNSIIPHAKIEKLISELCFEYIFVRPSYFMQNLITTLKDDVSSGCIMLPSGNAKFNWVDVYDIGEVAAYLLKHFGSYTNCAITVTGEENLSFDEVVNIINDTIHSRINYKSVNLLRFYRHKKTQGVSRAMIMVMIMLHFLPRFEKEPEISSDIKKIIGRKPRNIAQFALDNATRLKKRQ